MNLIAMTPFFSIIIPVYNVAPYLRECLDSVLAQTFTDWEAICVDDGSTDCSGAILDEYAAKDSRFRVIHQPNAGVSAARNKGLDIVQGQWIWFVDGDDYLMPLALRTFVNIPDKSDVTFFSMELQQEDGFRCAYFLKPVCNEKINDDSSSAIYTLTDNSLGVDLFGWTCDKVIRKGVICDGNIRFDEQVSFFEDELFALEVFRYAQTFSCLDDVLYRYRILTSGLTQSRTWEYFPIAQKFIQEGIRAKYRGLKEIALKQAFYFMLRAIRQKGGCGAAIEMLRQEKQLKIVGRISGRFARVAQILASFMPASIGGFILWIMLKTRDGIYNMPPLCSSSEVLNRS